MLDSFDKRFNYAMEEKGLTSSDIVRRTGISKSLISVYKKGKAEPKYENLVKIAKALNVNREWLAGTSDQMSLIPVDPQFGDDKANREYLKGNPELLHFYDLVTTRDEIGLLLDAAGELNPEEVKSVLQTMMMIINAKKS